MIFSYGSRRLRTNAFSFCCAAVLANSETSSIDCRLSFGSLVHWRIIFRRASRCFFITSCIGTLLEVDYSGSALTGGALPLFGFFLHRSYVMTKLMRSCSERTSSARSFTSQRPSPRSTSGPEVSRQASTGRKRGSSRRSGPCAGSRHEAAYPDDVDVGVIGRPDERHAGFVGDVVDDRVVVDVDPHSLDVLVAG